MSAPSESATSPSPCACTNISLMQLFHELKQKFPGVPDHVVSNTIELYCHDKQACETHLHREVKASLTHAYHASSSAAARQLSELKLNPPGKCRNQPIVKHEPIRPTVIQSQSIQGPQSAILSSHSSVDDEVVTDDNQNVVEPKTEEKHKSNPSPTTVINIDNCYAKYSVESPSDFELTIDNFQQEKDRVSALQKKLDQPESTNYRILKSNKIRSNLHERLEKNKEKKTIKKVDELPPTEEPPPEKPKRPNTLDFIKPNPDIAFKQSLKEPDHTNRSVSPAPQKSETSKDAKSFGSSKPEYGYPLNVSVKVNCHMDLSRGYGDPWLDDYDSPRTITSVNLTVCTPTSNMASPIRESIGEDEGLDGHVTVTVSPSTARPPRRRAPPPPPGMRVESPRPSRSAPEPPGTAAYDRSLIERQMERLSLLAKTLAQDKARLAQMNRETQILAAPPPTPAQTQQLRDYVEKLRQQCNTLSKRLELTGNEQSDADNFYSNIYTGQRPPAAAPWECPMCTFLNHPLLDKCEECTMARIFIGTSPLTRTHDSGFGSFRDRDRNIRSDGQRTELDPTSGLVENSCALNLNC